MLVAVNIASQEEEEEEEEEEVVSVLPQLKLVDKNSSISLKVKLVNISKTNYSNIKRIHVYFMF